MREEERNVLDAVANLEAKTREARAVSDARYAEIMRQNGEKELARIALLPPPPPPTPRMIELQTQLRRIRRADPDMLDPTLGAALGAARRELDALIRLQDIESDREREAAILAAKPPKRILAKHFGDLTDVMLVRVCEAHRCRLVIGGEEIVFPAPIAFVSAEEWPTIKQAIDDHHALLDRRGDPSRLALPLFGDDRFDIRIVATLAGETVESSDIGVVIGPYLQTFKDLRVLVRMAVTAEVGLHGRMHGAMGFAFPKNERPRGMAPLVEKIMDRARWIERTYASYGTTLGGFNSEVGTVAGAVAYWQRNIPVTEDAPIAETSDSDEPSTRRRRSREETQQERRATRSTDEEGAVSS